MRIFLPALLAAAMTAAACGQPDELAAPSAESSSPPAAAAGGPVTAVATVFPLAWIAEQVAPDAEVTFLGQRGQEAHDFELSPGDRVAIERSDVVLYLGDIDFQPQVEDAVPAASGEVVAVAEVVGDDALLTGAADAHAHEDAADDDHADEEDEAGDDHADEEGEDHAEDEDAVDPHVWFDAALMAEVAEHIGEAFATAAPDAAETYTANAESVASDLLALDAEIDGLLTGCAQDEAIVSHEAYAYLLGPRDLAQHGIAGINPEGGASPQALAELTAEIEAEGIGFVLAEPFEGRADAEALAAETGIELLDIDPLEVVTDEQFERGYIELLREQAQRFATALECGEAA